MNESEHLCPSGRCESGALLIGVVGASGKVGYLTPPAAVDDAFVDQALEGRAPERRFRFAQACAENGCDHWSEGRCGVIDAVVQMADEDTIEAEVGALPACGIRPRCRWFAQRGAAACRVCPLVVTDLMRGPDLRSEEKIASEQSSP
jgi:hypothetical protein